MASFDSRVVLITGASSGLGRSTAVEFARQGATLALTGRNKERLSETARMCSDVGLSEDKIYTIIGDLEIEEELRNVFREAVNHFGKLDVLINNAGNIIIGMFESLLPESLDIMYKLHVRIPYELCRLAVPYLEKTKGSIVNVSSVSSTVTTKQTAAYGSMKAAMDHFSRVIAHELAAKGIRVNTVNPGATLTPLAERLARKAGDGDVVKGFQMFDKQFPLGRLGRPEETAKAVVFLASPDSSFITGSNLYVDGGIHLTGRFVQDRAS